MMKRFLFIMGMALCMAEGYAQNLNGQRAKDAFDEFRKSVHAEFDGFRQQCMDEFIEFVRNPWKEFEETKPVPKPKDEKLPPLVMPEDEKKKPLEGKPVVIEEVVEPPQPSPQPEPVEPVKPFEPLKPIEPVKPFDPLKPFEPVKPIDPVEPVKPVDPVKPVEPIENEPVLVAKTVNITFYGSEISLRFDTSESIQLISVEENSVADALKMFKPEVYDNLLFDCLTVRTKMKLCDWAYLQLLEAVAERIVGSRTSNEKVLLLTYLFIQSGYKARFASDGSRLYMLYATNHTIYDRSRYIIDGESFYGLDSLPNRLFISSAAFHNEQCLSLLITNSPLFKCDYSERRTITSAIGSDMNADVAVNKNLIAFYNSYPCSMIDDNFMTRWAMYANTPISQEVKALLYPTIKKRLEGLSQLEAVNRLLNWVQTGFAYEYDDTLWGGDRAFFAEESLYYPYCDCEDRSILFTRLVRDLLGLNCILIYYPRHLASAVEFTEGEVSGDYIELDGCKFVVSDATYIGAPVGKTMPRMDNQTAKVIRLNR